MKKIMFNDKYGLTQAVLEGRKTQTRRLILPQPDYDEHKGMVWKGYMYGIKGYNAPYDAYDNFISTLKKFNRLPCNIGEEIAVAHSYGTMANEGGDILANMLQDETTFKPEYCGAGWKNKMFVKADLMLHRIKITNVRVERLQDISDADCLKEGVEKIKWEHSNEFYYMTKATPHRYNLAKDAFSSLIDKICGKGTWQSNPWVFVYDFELVK